MPYIFFLRGDWGLASATLASPWLRPCTVFVNAALSEMLARGSTETRQLQRLMTKTAAASGKTAAGAASDVYAGTEYTKERNYDDGKATEMRAGGGGEAAVLRRLFVPVLLFSGAGVRSVTFQSHIFHHPLLLLLLLLL